jgi:hypothetical protein
VRGRAAGDVVSNWSTSALDKIGTIFVQDFQTHNAKSATNEAEYIQLFIKAITVDPPASPEQFPESTGIIVFSRVGFERTNKQALGYVGRICGPLCGSGYPILLIESQGAWKVEDEYLRWLC